MVTNPPTCSLRSLLRKAKLAEEVTEAHSVPRVSFVSRKRNMTITSFID
jgi:hypothetical protein